MKKEKVIDLIKTNYTFLADEFGIEKIGLFGSVARGTETPESDVDIVVKFKTPIGFKFIALVEYLENLLNSKVDVLTLDGINNIRFKTISDDIMRSIIYV
jgi:predicted nucleotidyltransferase